MLALMRVGGSTSRSTKGCVTQRFEFLRNNRCW